MKGLITEIKGDCFAAGFEAKGSEFGVHIKLEIQLGTAKTLEEAQKLEMSFSKAFLGRTCKVTAQRRRK